MRRAFPLALFLAMLMAACGDSGGPTTSGSPPLTTTAAATTTAAPATTTTTAPGSTAPATTAPATTTTAPATTTTAAAATTTTAAVTTTTVDVNLLASGSGCTSGSGALPDGRWFGYVESAGAASIEFDLACWFSGEPAIRASAEDGEESPPPNDYYIRNVNPALRTVQIASGAQVNWMPNPGDPATAATITYAAWLTDRGTRGWQPAVWVEISGGSGSFIEEQYQP